MLVHGDCDVIECLIWSGMRSAVVEVSDRSLAGVCDPVIFYFSCSGPLRLHFGLIASHCGL